VGGGGEDALYFGRVFGKWGLLLFLML